MGLEHAKAVQQYEAIALVVSQAFGGEEEKKDNNPESFDAAEASFKALFSGR